MEFSNFISPQRHHIRHDFTCESSASRLFTRYIKPYFSQKKRMLQNLSSAAVVIGILRVNHT